MNNGTNTSFPVLKTQRLTLRQLSTNDEAQIFTLRSDPKIDQYLDRPPCETMDDARQFIHKIIESGALYWAITNTGDDTLVGTICLFGISEEDKKAETGYELLTGYQGQGIMQEALSAVTDYAFSALALRKIEAFTHQDNQASARLLEKCGFRITGSTDAENPLLKGYCLTRNSEKLDH